MSVHTLRAAEAIANGIPPKTQREYVAWLDAIIQNCVDEELAHVGRWNASPNLAREKQIDADEVKKDDRAWSDTYQEPPR